MLAHQGRIFCQSCKKMLKANQSKLRKEVIMGTYIIIKRKTNDSGIWFGFLMSQSLLFP